MQFEHEFEMYLTYGIKCTNELIYAFRIQPQRDQNPIIK